MQGPLMNGLVSSPSSRRSFFEQVGSGLCGAALASVLSDDLFGRSLQAADDICYLATNESIQMERQQWQVHRFPLRMFFHPNALRENDARE